MARIKLFLWLSVALMAAGVIATAGYYMYCTHLSGKSVGKFQLSERSSSWTLPGGMTLRLGGNTVLKPFSVNLDPTMNPVGFIWSGKIAGFIGHQASSSNQYMAALYLGKRLMMSETISISADGDEKKAAGTLQWTSIGMTDVPSAGQYDFVLEERARPELTVTGIQIEVRRNVMVPSMTVMLSGAGVFVVGLVLFFVFGNLSNKDEYQK